MSDTYTPDDDGVRISVAPSPFAIDEKRANDFIARRKKDSETYSSRFDEVMKQRQAAIAEASSVLDRTIQELRDRQGGGAGGVNLPLLALGAGLLQGAPPGQRSNFGQELGRGLASMGQTIRAQRMSDTDFLQGIAKLQQAQAQLKDVPLADEAKRMEERQRDAEKAQTDIEKALIKGGGGSGGAPSKVKEYQEWLRDPKNTGKSYGDFLEWRAKNLGADKTPANLAEFAEWKKSTGKESASFDDFLAAKAAAQAKGRAVGTGAGEAQMALPKFDMVAEQMLGDVDKLIKHPGIDKAVGLTSVLPDIPGGDSADFNAQLGRLKGQAFLQAFESLKGAGAITETEGAKATDALAALSTKQSKKQFVEQLNTIREVLAKGRKALKERAAGAPTTETPAKSSYSGPIAVDANGKRHGVIDGKWAPIE